MVTIYNFEEMATKDSKFKVEILNGCKYHKGVKVVRNVIYSDVKKVEILSLNELAQLDGLDLCIDSDENNEYLRLTFIDDSTATYRNSHVDLFRI